METLLLSPQKGHSRPPFFGWCLLWKMVIHLDYCWVLISIFGPLQLKDVSSTYLNYKIINTTKQECTVSKNNISAGIELWSSFRATFVKWSAHCYRTVVLSVLCCLSCLSVTLVYCAKRLDQEPPIFGPCLLWPNGWMDQDATWYGGRPLPKRHCVTWGPSSPPKNGQPRSFRPMSIVAKWLYASGYHFVRR